MIPEEMDFYDFSMLADDPKRLEAYENSFYDPDYEEFERMFDEEMAAQKNQQTLMRNQEREELEERGYEVPVDVLDDEEWERVE